MFIQSIGSLDSECVGALFCQSCMKPVGLADPDSHLPVIQKEGGGIADIPQMDLGDPAFSRVKESVGCTC